MKRLVIFLAIVALVSVFSFAPFMNIQSAEAMGMSGFYFFPDTLAVSVDCSIVILGLGFHLVPDDDDVAGRDYMSWVVRDGNDVIIEAWSGWVPTGAEGDYFVDVWMGYVNTPTALPFIVSLHDTNDFLTDVGSILETPVTAITAVNPLEINGVGDCYDNLSFSGQLPPGDGRENPVAREPWQTAAVYCRADNGIDVYEIVDGAGVLAFRATPEEIGLVGDNLSENTMIDSGMNTALYRLTTGEYQVNGPNGYVYIWPGCGEVPTVVQVAPVAPPVSAPPPVISPVTR